MEGTGQWNVRIEVVLGSIERDIRSKHEPRAMANQVKLSVSRFYDLFRHETGTVPKRYIRSRRFQRAQELLVNSHMSVKEVASAVGIHDVSHFVRDFQKIYGVSPRRFRREYASVPRSDNLLIGKFANES